jgi:sigma-B regulation protein RsbU (phosphoserine phosphatase)
MAATRAYLHAVSQTYAQVGRILSVVNRLLTEDIQDSRFVTLFFGLINPEKRCLAYASAGHVEGHLLDARGEVKAVLPSTTVPLGVLPEASFRARPPLTLAPGDTLLLLTDGVVEARNANGEEFGFARALDAIRGDLQANAQQMTLILHRACCDFLAGASPVDDLTILIVKARGEE